MCILWLVFPCVYINVSNSVNKHCVTGWAVTQVLHSCTYRDVSLCSFLWCLKENSFVKGIIKPRGYQCQWLAECDMKFGNRLCVLAAAARGQGSVLQTLCKYYEKLLCCKSDLSIFLPQPSPASLICLSVSFSLVQYACRQMYPKAFPIGAA